MSIKSIVLDDRSSEEIKSDLGQNFEAVIQLAEVFEETFESNILLSANYKYKWVQEYLFLSFESCVSAMRLLVEGHINASGNTMRIAYESLCMSILLSAHSEVKVGRGTSEHSINFYQRYEAGDKRTKAHTAIDCVVKNATALGLTEGGQWLKGAKNFYNGYSHASMVVFSSLVLPSGRSIIGGGYDEHKKDIIINHLDFIGRFLKQSPGLTNEIAKRNITR